MYRSSTILIILISFTCIFSQSDRIERTFEDVNTLNIKISSGTIIISRSNTSNVTVNAVYNKKYDEPLIEKRGRKLVIKYRNSHRSSSFWNDDSRSEWQITVPQNMDITCATGSGNIDIEDLTVKELQANTGSGKISFKSIYGPAHVATGSGRIKVQDYKGEIRAITGSGRIEFSQAEGDLKATSGSGDIILKTINGKFKLNTGSGDIEGTDLVITQKTSANTGSGDIMFALKAELKSNLNLNTGSGDIELDFNENKISGYFELKTRRENQIRAPFKLEGSSKRSRWGNAYVIKTAKVGNADHDITLNTGSGRLEIVE